MSDDLNKTDDIHDILAKLDAKIDNLSQKINRLEDSLGDISSEVPFDLGNEGEDRPDFHSLLDHLLTENKKTSNNSNISHYTLTVDLSKDAPDC